MPIDRDLYRHEPRAALPPCPDLSARNWMANPHAHPNPRAVAALLEHACCNPVRPVGNAPAWRMAREMGIPAHREDRA